MCILRDLIGKESSRRAKRLVRTRLTFSGLHRIVLYTEAFDIPIDAGVAQSDSVGRGVIQFGDRPRLDAHYNFAEVQAPSVPPLTLRPMVLWLLSTVRSFTFLRSRLFSLFHAAPSAKVAHQVCRQLSVVSSIRTRQGLHDSFIVLHHLALKRGA